MERLQEALSRARERREKSGANIVDNAGRAGSAALDPKRAARVGSAVRNATHLSWQDLAPFVPNEDTLRSNRVVSYFGNREAAPFDMMRTKIVHQMKANNWRRLVVTSPSPRCGKTTITANLAFSLARQHELRTLVFEVDLRRPELAKILGIEKELFFSKVLSGAEPASEHMVRYNDNLAFATSVAPTPRSSELLQSAYARNVITEIEQAFEPDIVLFDSPPMMGSDDTIGFLGFADAALIVAASELTSIKEIDVAEAEIASATNVLGVVVNKVRDASSESYEYGYGY